ncbi:MAG: DUF3416 domain-containing protein, partial [Verrucomicrobia bacterium]|nr:DUF3416 domain-containing protein [Verrucomicrobiota bacterium]
MHRVVITNVFPELEKGRCSIKRCVGDTVVVEADIFTDGHTEVAASLLYRKADEKEWQRVEMEPRENDRWQADFKVDAVGKYLYRLQAWQNQERALPPKAQITEYETTLSV